MDDSTSPRRPASLSAATISPSSGSRFRRDASVRVEPTAGRSTPSATVDVVQSSPAVVELVEAAACRTTAELGLLTRSVVDELISPSTITTTPYDDRIVWTTRCIRSPLVTVIGLYTPDHGWEDADWIRWNWGRLQAGRLIAAYIPCFPARWRVVDTTPVSFSPAWQSCSPRIIG